MNFKLLGSILLIVGTSIGAGMLALPIATAQLGFLGSIILLIVCWSVMTAGAFLLLEVNLWLPINSNIISMAGKTIGPFGQIIAWITYLLLLYSLLCAYIAGGSDLFHNLLSLSGISIPASIAAVIFTCIFGFIVYLGIKSVDYINRGLMFVKLGAYVLLVLLLSSFIKLPLLKVGDMHYLTSISAITVTITSFGYAAIVPSLRIYFAGDVKQLKKAILIGSLIPLVCYIAWDAAIMGVLPLSGEHGLLSILDSKNSTSSLVNNLSAVGNYSSIAFFTKLFTSICVVTSFLGVALCVVDFLADGFKLEKTGAKNILVHLVTFIPPVLIVLFFPNMFVTALQYAGIYCVILLILLPAWMAWRGRYHAKLKGTFNVSGGKILLGILILFSLIILIKSLFWL